MIGRPPVFLGATQLIPALATPFIPAKELGASGRPAATIILEREAALWPMLLTDFTENTQLEPYFRPETVTEPPVGVSNGVGRTIDCGATEGNTKLTTYPVIGLAGLEAFAVQVRLITPAAPRTAFTFGTPGRAYDVNETESLWAAAFTATTVQVVGAAFFRFVTNNSLASDAAVFDLLLFGAQRTL